MSDTTLVCKTCNISHEAKMSHAGFGQEIFLYCDSCPTVIVWSHFDDRYRQVAGTWVTRGRIIKVSGFGTGAISELTEDQKKAVEDAIKPCPCGGRFKFENKLLCPNCKTPLAGNIFETIYLYILDKFINGHKYNIWKKKNYFKKEPPAYES